MQCCKCDKNLAVVSCVECAKSLGIEEEAKMCEECCTTLHEALGKYSATHNVVTLEPENKVKQEFEHSLHEYNELKEQRQAARLKELDEAMKQVEASYIQLQEEMTQSVEQFKAFLDVKLSEFVASVAVTRDHKLQLLTQKRKQIQEEQQFSSSPSLVDDSGIETMEGKLADLKQLLAILKQTRPLSSLPPLCGGTSCGFCPELITLHRTTVCMKTAHQAELMEGDNVASTVIGSLSKEGTFWVRMLPDEHGTQDTVLQNISNTLQVEFSLMGSIPKLSFLRPGDLCAAKYSQDQRWYRARVVNPKAKNGKVLVFFLDYGNSEELSLSSLAPLHEKYQVYPFQMVQCCFSTDNNLTYDREVKWKFADLTHSRNLSTTILECSHVNMHGTLYVVQLLDETGSEAFDVGKTVLVMAEKGADKNGRSSIKCRDIRLKNQDLPANFEHIVSTSTSGVSKQQQQQQEQEEQLEGEKQMPPSKPVVTKETSDIEPAKLIVTDEVQPLCESEVNHDTEETSEVAEMKTEEEQKPFQKPQARVKPLKIEEEPSPPVATESTEVISLSEVAPIVTAEEQKEDIHVPLGMNESSLYPVIKPGVVLELYVTTGLSPDGSFWAQLPTTSEYDTMVEKLQELEKDTLTPVFFNRGDLCAAVYSEDEFWYRARIEDVDKGVFTVRYLDFGNSETRENQHLSPLPSQFRVVPFQALHCSIADECSTSFSQISIERFDEILSTEDPISAKVFKVEEDVVSVQLELKIGDAEPVDINWEVCSADVSKLKSMSFTSKKTEKKPLKVPASLSEPSRTVDWGISMDELASPQNDGYFTLSGVDSRDHSKTPTPTPTPVPEPAISKESKKTERSVSPLNIQSGDSIRLTTTRPGPHLDMRVATNRTIPTPVPEPAISKESKKTERSVSPLNIQSGDSTRSTITRPGPRLDMGVARNQILSSLGPRRKDRTEGDAVKSSHPPEPGKVWDHSSTRQRDHAYNMGSTVPRRHKMLEPDTNQVKIYVRNVPLEKTVEEVRELFGQFGTIYGLQYHTEFKDRVFLLMGKSEGSQAIEKLDGHMFTKNGRPLVVQLGHNQRTNLSTQRHTIGLSHSSSSLGQHSPISGSLENVSSGDRMKLFVKNIPVGKALDDIKDIFSKYGKVFEIEHDPSRHHVVFLHTTVEAGRKAIAALHGKAIGKSSRPLVVEESYTA